MSALKLVDAPKAGAKLGLQGIKHFLKVAIDFVVPVTGGRHRPSTSKQLSRIW
jgi:hypothetical protein